MVQEHNAAHGNRTVKLPSNKKAQTKSTKHICGTVSTDNTIATQQLHGHVHDKHRKQHENTHLMLTLHKEQTTITKTQGKALKRRWTPQNKTQSLPHCTGDPRTNKHKQETWPDTVENSKTKTKHIHDILPFLEIGFRWTGLLFSILEGEYELRKGCRLGPGPDDATELTVLSRVLRYT